MLTFSYNYFVRYKCKDNHEYNAKYQTSINTMRLNYKLFTFINLDSFSRIS